MTTIAIFVAIVFVYSQVSVRLEQTVLTAPLVFMTAGICVPLGSG